jgi:hypothetical protein
MAMKTTLNIDDELLRAAKKMAADRGITLTRFVENALREALRRRRDGKPFRFRWITERGVAPPAVDISDRKALYDAMEGRT